MARRLGIFLCLIGIVAAFVLPLVLNTDAPFGSLNGIEDDIESAAGPILDEAIIVPDGAQGAQVVAEGRDLIVTLPETVTRNPDMAGLSQRLSEIDGVRSVDFGDVAPRLLPTEVEAETPTAEAEPDPTAEPEAEQESAADSAEEAAVEASRVVAALGGLEVDFLPGTATLTPNSAVRLTDAANLLSRDIVGGPIQVQSHTSDEGDPDVNFLLTQDRAEAVVQYLVSEGIDPATLTAQGFGAAEPIADNATAEGRAANERVVLIVEEG